MDKKPEKLVPEVRFKGFTDDWEQRKGKSIFYSKSNKDFPELTVLSATQDKGMVPRSSTGIDIKYEKKSLRGYKKIEPGDFVVHLRSFQGGFAYSDLTGIVSPAYTIFTFKQPEMFNNYFWKEKFTSYNFIQLLKKVTYGVRDGRSISYSDFLTLNEKFPIKVEQTKIADLFKIIDKLITLQQRKLEQLKRLKTAMLQQLLANQSFPKVRFNDFKDSWKDYRLGEVFDEFSVKSKRENEYKLLSSTTSGMESRSGRVSGHSNIGYKVIDNGDIVLSPQNLWLGNINLNNMGKGIVSPSYHTFKIVNANPIFVNFQLKTKKMLFEYKMVSVQGASIVRRNLDMDAFKKIVIKIPNEKEQIKIASLFSSISNIINNHQNKLTQLTTLKKYLLQKMFI
ncbi:MAG: restriction endonuclease subunit S [Lactobacillus sp.]|nr:restriction endonuclease subunit S [Lactobacillus sp.]